MLYRLVRPVARYVLRYYYRRIDLSGLENVPPAGAVILAANHPTAFIEPCLLACFQPRPLRFLARGDLFGNWWQNTLLAAINILPVYRIEDGGYGKLRRNYDTFAACYEALGRGRAIMILAEGRCIHEKRLRPLRKGTARIALGTLADQPALDEVYIVPVGVNFTAAARVRSEVYIRLGEPIRATAFVGEDRLVTPVALQNLTLHLRDRLLPLVTQIPERKLDALGEARLQTLRAKLEPRPVYGLTQESEIATREHAVAAATPSEDDGNLRYHNRLMLNDLEATSAGADEGIPPTPQRGEAVVVWIRTLVSIVLQIPQFPLWITAEAIASALPKTVEFYSPVRFAVVAGGTFILYPLGLILLPWPLKLWLLAAILSVRWSLRGWENLARYREGRRRARLVPAEQRLLDELREVAERAL